MEISAAFLENLFQYLKAFKGAPLSHIQLYPPGIPSPFLQICPQLTSLTWTQLRQEAITHQMQDLAFVFAHHKFIVRLFLCQVLVNSSNNRHYTDLSPKLMLLTGGCHLLQKVVKMLNN